MNFNSSGEIKEYSSAILLMQEDTFIGKE